MPAAPPPWLFGSFTPVRMLLVRRARGCGIAWVAVLLNPSTGDIRVIVNLDLLLWRLRLLMTGITLPLHCSAAIFSSLELELLSVALIYCLITSGHLGPLWLARSFALVARQSVAGYVALGPVFSLCSS